MNAERLDKIISATFNISRSQARKSVLSGLASVNGQKVRDFSLRIDPVADKILFKGQTVYYKKNIYIIMNKPTGILSASSDKNRRTVVDLVPENLRRAGLFPVGRLDKDTTGLLIITDNGDFAHRVISPKSSIYKTYIALLDGRVTDEMCEIFRVGVTLADKTVCRGAELTPLDGNYAMIKICEGRYHQIKRMFGTVGLGVVSLHRSAIGSLVLPEDIPPGRCREMNPQELEMVFKQA